MSILGGPALVLLFCLSQAFRDVYFAGVFQAVDFFAVIVLAFASSTAIFGLATLMRTPGAFGRMRQHARTILWMNLTTVLPWTCYFFALKTLEPSIVNTIHSGMAPLTVVVLGAFGIGLAQRGPVGRLEYGCYAGIALSIAGLWWVVLAGRSGLGARDHGEALLGLALLLVSGTSITISLLYSKRLHDAGVDADAVTAVRYPALILLAVAVLAISDRPTGIGGPGHLLILAAAATALIALPTFALQAGVARTPTLTAQIIRALGPVFVFGLEQIDQRLVWSTPTLVFILGYSAFVIAGNFAHGWRNGAAARHGGG